MSSKFRRTASVMALAMAFGFAGGDAMAARPESPGKAAPKGNAYGHKCRSKPPRERGKCVRELAKANKKAKKSPAPSPSPSPSPSPAPEPTPAPSPTA